MAAALACIGQLADVSARTLFDDALMSDTGPRTAGPLLWTDAMDEDPTAAPTGFSLPTGTVTFLMTDIAGSTAGWERSAGVMAAAVARHYELLDDAIASHRGVRPLEQGEGDSVVAAFSRPSDAVATAAAAQLAFRAEPWPGSVGLTVRMAVHTGEAQLRDDRNYFGPVVIRCARIRDTGHGEQVLLSDVTASLVADALPDGAGLLDLGRVRLKDLGRPERVWQLTHERLRADFGPLRGLDSYRQNLPVQRTPLFGRERAIASVGELLAEERVVTLLGSGGVGKTRLAIAVGAEALDDWPGGVWFLDLAATGGDDTTGRVALRALGVTEIPSSEPAQQFATELDGAGRCLLIVDNCEHTLDDVAAFVTTVLEANADVSVLATSREPIGVSGEVTWRVPSLATPPRQEPVRIEALPHYEAVAMFIDRARRARPSFRVTDENAPAVAQVCQRLDGIPLAIELAAARVRQLSVERIAAELDDRFRLLVGGTRVAIPRHQTLSASVEWSHDLLDEDEQIVLRRLGVFAGRFALEAAEQVVPAVGRITEVAVFDTVARLVDKSLVIMEDEGPVSYRLLETIRAFAIARARDAGELFALREAHVSWWIGRIGIDPAKRSAGDVTGPTDDIVALVEDHHDDLIAALDWAAARDDPTSGLELMWPLARAFTGAGGAGDAIDAFERLLRTEVERRHPRRWLRAATSACVPIGAFKGPDAFVDLVQRAHRVAVQLGDELYEATSAWLVNRSVDTSRRLQSVSADLGEPYPHALATVALAMAACDEAPADAFGLLTEATSVAAAYGSRYLEEFASSAEARQGFTSGDIGRTIREGRRFAEARTPTMRLHGTYWLVSGGLAAGDGAILEEAQAMAARDVRRGVFEARRRLEVIDSALDLVTGNAAHERVAFGSDVFPLLACRDAADRGERDVDRAAVAGVTGSSVAHRVYQQVLSALLDEDEALWHEALHGAVRHRLRPVVIDCLEGLATLAGAADSPVEALRLLGAADRLAEETGYRWRFPSERARRDRVLAQAAEELGDEGVDLALAEGRALTWSDAAEYVRRARGERRRPRHGWASLTPTELKVIELVMRGATNPEIAEALLMSRSTVKSHLEHVYAKTGLHNRTELAAEATRRNPSS
jgi:predicted ATPase/class 3 adenylate cyclase/DNA-binding CsgD family transcriptional regulator